MFDFTAVKKMSLGHEVVSMDFITPNSSSNIDVDIFCPTGKVATGGGMTSSSGRLDTSGPIGRDGWRVTARFGTFNTPYTVHVVCVNDF